MAEPSEEPRRRAIAGRRDEVYLAATVRPLHASSDGAEGLPDGSSTNASEVM